MTEIKTYQSVDLNGAKELRTSECPGICVRAAATPDICVYYNVADGVEKCSRDEDCSE